MEYIYDEASMLMSLTAKRKHYLQRDEVLTGSIPELISDPKALSCAFDHIQNDGPCFDVE